MKEEEKEEEEAGQEVEDRRREPFRGDTRSLTQSLLPGRRAAELRGATREISPRRSGKVDL